MAVSKIFLTCASGLRETLIPMVTAILVCGSTVVALHLLGFDAVALMRDRTLSDAPAAGLISDTGIALTAAASVLALLHGAAARDIPLTLLGVFTAIFALDDALMLHENLGNERVFFGFYGVFALVLLKFFNQRTPHLLPWPLVVTFGCFAASVGLDVTWTPLVETLSVAQRTSDLLYGVGYILEDLPKFGGIVIMASFSIGEALRAAASRTMAANGGETGS